MRNSDRQRRKIVADTASCLPAKWTRNEVMPTASKTIYSYSLPWRDVEDLLVKAARSMDYSLVACHSYGSVRRSLTCTTLLTLVHALMVTKVDYCSSVLSGISGQLLQRLQSVFNAAARLVFSARKSEHITPLLREVNSVPVVCSRVSCPYRHGAIIPCCDPPLNCRRRFTSASSECFCVDAGHTVHTTHHAG